MQTFRKSRARLRSKISVATHSVTAWFSLAVPAVRAALVAAEALKEDLPMLAPYLTGWRMVAASWLASAVVVALRTRHVGGME
jgi:hypothetical protein